MKSVIINVIATFIIIINNTKIIYFSNCNYKRIIINFINNIQVSITRQAIKTLELYINIGSQMTNHPP